MTILISVKNLQKHYDNGFQALKGVNLDIEDGEIIAQTRIAEATIKLLKLNEAERLIQRRLLMKIGRWP